MPNKTIYVSDEDLPLYERAQHLASGSLSAAIATALRQFVEREEANMQGFDEVTIPVGKAGSRRTKTFSGRALTRWVHRTGSDHTEVFTVYRTARGQYAVHLERNQSWREWADPSMWVDAGGWSRMVSDWCRAFGRQSGTDRPWARGPRWGLAPGCIESRLDVYPTLDDLEADLPAELIELVREAESDARAERLDI